MLLYIWLCKNIDLLCWAYKKFNSFLSFHSPVFYSKIHKRRGKFFERGEGVNSLKRTYVEKEVHVKRTETNKGEGGAKIGNFEQTYFFNAPLLKSDIFTAVFMFLMVKSFKKWLEMKKHFFLHMCYWYSFETFFLLNSNTFLWHIMHQYSKNFCQQWKLGQFVFCRGRVVYSKHCHTIKMELSVSIVHDWEPLIIFTKSSMVACLTGF